MSKVRAQCPILVLEERRKKERRKNERKKEWKKKERMNEKKQVALTLQMHLRWFLALDRTYVDLNEVRTDIGF